MSTHRLSGGKLRRLLLRAATVMRHALAFLRAFALQAGQTHGGDAPAPARVAPREAQTSVAERPVAVVFIHGIGVQDRYQQLTAFTEGLLRHHGGSFAVARRDAPKNPCDPSLDPNFPQPKGRFVPLCVSPANGQEPGPPVAVDVHEIYYAPLLHNIIKPVGVLQWAWLTLSRANPQHRKAIKQDRVNRGDGERPAQTPLGKWVFEISYLLTVTVLAGLVYWWVLSALLLATDQLTATKPGTKAVAHMPVIWRPVIGRKAMPVEELFTGPERGQYWAELRDWVTAPAEPKHPYWTWTERFAVGRLFLRQAGDYAFDRRQGGGVSVDVQGVLSRIKLADLLFGAAYVVFLYYALKNFLSIFSTLYRLVRVSVSGRAATAGGGGGAASPGRLWQRIGLLILFVGASVYLTSLCGHLTPLIVTLVLLPLAVYQTITRLMRLGLSDVVGGIPVYTSRNENSGLYQGHQAVLAGARADLDALLGSDKYDAVYLVGHSLGSVVGLDMLRRLYSDYALVYANGDAAATQFKARYEKIKGFITLGSPLEKTLLFLDQRDYKEGFEEYSHTVDGRIFTTPGAAIPAAPHCFPWFNFWIWTDIVSDPLWSYPVAADHDLRLPGHVNLWSHSDYWADPLFVANVLRIVCHPPAGLNELIIKSDMNAFTPQKDLRSPQAENALPGSV